MRYSSTRACSTDEEAHTSNTFATGVDLTKICFFVFCITKGSLNDTRNK
jgi:hypothetical protein